MKKDSFIQRLKNEFEFIVFFLKTIPHNQRIDFVSKKKLESEDGIHNIKLPLIVHTDKEGYTSEWCAIGITRKGNKLIVHGKDETGEAEKEFVNFSIKTLDIVNLAFLADLVKKKL